MEDAYMLEQRRAASTFMLRARAVLAQVLLFPLLMIGRARVGLAVMFDTQDVRALLHVGVLLALIVIACACIGLALGVGVRLFLWGSGLGG